MEWIFAYLKYQMTPKDYYAMRRNLFEKALKEGFKHPETRKIIEKSKVAIEERLVRKWAKAAAAEALESKFPLPFHGVTREQFEAAENAVRGNWDQANGESNYGNCKFVEEIFLCLEIDMWSQLTTDYHEAMDKKVKEVLVLCPYSKSLEEFAPRS